MWWQAKQYRWFQPTDVKGRNCRISVPTFNKSNHCAIAGDCGRCFSFPGSLQKNRDVSSGDLNMKYVGLLLDGEQWLIIKYAFVKGVKKHMTHQCSYADFFFLRQKQKTSWCWIAEYSPSNWHIFIYSFFSRGLVSLLISCTLLWTLNRVHYQTPSLQVKSTKGVSSDGLTWVCF